MGFVQQEQVRRGKQQAGERDAHAPAAGEILERLVEACLGNAQTRKNRTGFRFDPIAPHHLEAVAELAVGRRELLKVGIAGAHLGHLVLIGFELLFHETKFGEAVEHGSEHAPLADGFDFLRQVADANRPAAVDLAGVLRVFAGEDAQDRRFSRAVGPDEPPSRPAVDHPRQPVEQDARAEAALDAVDVDHRAAITKGPGPTTRETGVPNPERTRRSDC